MRQHLLSAAVFAVSLGGSRADPSPSPSPSSSSSTTTHVAACTATASAGSGGFFDLRPIRAHPANSGAQHKAGVTKDYRSKGYDYGKNFTLNICGAVIDPVTDVMGVAKSSWANVSAYYVSHGSVYSIGLVNLLLS